MIRYLVSFALAGGFAWFICRVTRTQRIDEWNPDYMSVGWRASVERGQSRKTQ